MIISVDAGGTQLKAALVTDDGAIIDNSCVSRPSGSAGTKDEIIGNLAESLGELFRFAEEHGWAVDGITFSYPGPFNYGEGKCMMHHKYQAVYDVPLIPEVRKRCHLPDVPVQFFHDLHAFTFGEYRYGAGMGAENLICVAIGTGVGTGYVSGGYVETAPDEGPKYSIYKLEYRDGTVEDIVSARGITGYYRKLTGAEESPKEIQLRAEQGEQAAVETYREVGKALGTVLPGVINDGRIDTLVCGGQISRAHELFVPTLAEYLNGCSTLERIVPAADFSNSGIRGAAALMKQDVLKVGV